MAGTVKLPGFGEVKTTYVWVGAAVVAFIVGVAYWRHRSSAAAANSASTDTSGTAAIDPQTGYPTGSPEDLAALQQLQSGLGGAYASGYGGGGYAGNYSSQQYYYDPADGLYDLTAPYSPATSSTANTGPGTFTDNAYWTQYAIENVQGYSASDVQAALALYLAGQGLTTTQMSIYQAAIAVAGPAPSPPSAPAHLVNGGGGATGGGGGGGGGGSGGGTLHAPGGVRVKSKTPTGFTVTWNGVPNAAGYEVEITHQGTEIAHGTREGNTDHQLSVGGLKAGTSYGIRVAAFGSSGQGPSSAVIYEYTSK